MPRGTDGESAPLVSTRAEPKEETRSTVKKRELVATLLALVLTACSSVCETRAPRTGPLAAWDPIDEAFAGCQAACGAHVEGADPGIVTQPGASIGDRTYCPVSGAVFTVAAEHTHAEVDGHTVWFCCAGCAAYFEAHRDEVLDARGMRGTPPARAGTEPTRVGG